jgi:hypothetical protein
MDKLEERKKEIETKLKEIHLHEEILLDELKGILTSIRELRNYHNYDIDDGWFSYQNIHKAR